MWIGKSAVFDHVFDSDRDDPLRFEVHETDGYVYRGGKGTVRFPDGRTVSLPPKLAVKGGL